MKGNENKLKRERKKEEKRERKERRRREGLYEKEND